MKSKYTVFINCKVYTIDKDNSIHEAIVINDEKIIYVGNQKYAMKLIDENSDVIDTKGKIILPGFIDSHIHPPGTSLTELYEVSLYGLNSIEEYLDEISKFINNNPGIDIVYGKGWSLGAFSGDELARGPKKEHLDKVSKDIPIVLRAYDGHTIWLNSKAFEIFNIAKDTPPPIGGKIELNPITKELWGSLKESATHLVKEQDYSIEQYVKAFELFQNKMHSFGITSIFSISGLNWGITPAAYEKLFKEDKLKLRVSNGIMIFSDKEVKSQIDEVIYIRNKYKNKFFKTTGVKLLGDGVVEGGTANLLNPYTLDAGKGENYLGDFLWKQHELKKAIKFSNENNFSVHIHSVGDGSTNKVLDAIEETSGKKLKDYRNAITHLQLVDKEDIKRFKDLNVIAAVQPYWHIKGPGWWEYVDYKLLGDRAEKEYPLNTFIKEGVKICSSSDHSVTPTPNPFFAIEAGVTRNLYNSKFFGVEDIDNMDDERYLLSKDERVSVTDMVRSFTIDGAYSIFRDNEVGSIEVGKYADFIVIDRDIFAINPIDIENTKVLMTFFNGQLVYKNTLDF
ncbi:MAG: amidohydrolase [Peptostreptococcaceae bacterium]